MPFQFRQHAKSCSLDPLLCSSSIKRLVPVPSAYAGRDKGRSCAPRGGGSRGSCRGSCSGGHCRGTVASSSTAAEEEEQEQELKGLCIIRHQKHFFAQKGVKAPTSSDSGPDVSWRETASAMAQDGPAAAAEAPPERPIASMPELTSQAEWPWRKVESTESVEEKEAPAEVPEDKSLSFRRDLWDKYDYLWRERIEPSQGLLQKVADLLRSRAELERKYGESLLGFGGDLQVEPGRLGMDDVGYGAASSALFYTYVCFQWPHAWIAKRLGVRLWLAAVVALWGCATLLTAWVDSATELVLSRLLIGFAEAGSFPLIYMHLDSYLPAEEVSRSWSVIVAASQVASIVSGPLAAGLIQLPVNQMVSEHWEWLFVVEGFFALVVAAVVYCCLFDDSGNGDMLHLTTEEMLALANARGNSVHQAALPKQTAGGSKCRLLSGGLLDWKAWMGEKRAVLRRWYVPCVLGLGTPRKGLDSKAWYLGIVSLLIATPVYAFMFFSPELIHTILGASASPWMVDMLNGLPYLCGALMMISVGQTINFFSERFYHGSVSMILAAVLAISFPMVYEKSSPIVALVNVCLLYGVAAAVYIPMDTMPSAYCAESAESYSILNSIKSISGIIGPPLFGAVREAVDGPTAVAVLGLSEVLGLALFLIFFMLIGELRASVRCTELPIEKIEHSKSFDNEVPDMAKFGRKHGQLPPVRDAAAADECVQLAKEMNSARISEGEPSVFVEEVEADVVKNVAMFARCMISPMAAFLGGVVAQEVVKFTGKYTPLHQFLYLDMFELCPAPEPPDWKPLGSRYDDQIAIFGSAIQQAISNMKLFLVGAGALGCEFLKSFAMSLGSVLLVTSYHAKA
eukprot:s5514_g3.t1